MPRLSVVMSVCNGERYLKEAVDSILCQTYGDFEFIVIDDGSSDGTPEILAGYRDRRMRVVRQPNSGLTRSLNRGVQMNTAEYIARMDADDVSLPTRLEKQVAFLDSHPEVGMVGTAYYEINRVGTILGLRSPPTADRELRKTLIRLNPFFHASVMLRREVFSRVGLYDDSLPPLVEDYDLWFRVAKEFRLANLPDPLAIRRYHAENLSLRKEGKQVQHAIRIRWAAIRRGDYPFWCVTALARPLLVLLTPAWLRNWIRRQFLGRRF